jgi:hypothetical protein
MAWQRISPDVTVQGFKKYCLSSAENGTDDGMLWNGSEEGRNIRSGCEEDDSTYYGYGGSDTAW